MEYSKEGLEAADRLCDFITDGFLTAESFCENWRKIYQTYAENHIRLEEHSAATNEEAALHLFFMGKMVEIVTKVMKGEKQVSLSVEKEAQTDI